jgi:hypothetical protein
MRVIDHDQRRILAAHLLHAAGRRLQRFAASIAQAQAFGQHRAITPSALLMLKRAHQVRAHCAAQRALQMEFGAAAAAARSWLARSISTPSMSGARLLSAACSRSAGIAGQRRSQLSGGDQAHTGDRPD